MYAHQTPSLDPQCTMLHPELIRKSWIRAHKRPVCFGAIAPQNSLSACGPGALVGECLNV